MNLLSGISGPSIGELLTNPPPGSTLGGSVIGDLLSGLLQPKPIHAEPKEHLNLPIQVRPIDEGPVILHPQPGGDDTPIHLDPIENPGAHSSLERVGLNPQPLPPQAAEGDWCGTVTNRFPTPPLPIGPLALLLTGALR